MEREALLALAGRCVWWKPPEQTVANQRYFLGHALERAQIADWPLLARNYSPADLRDALTHASPGTLSPQSWHFWHHRLGFPTVPPLPKKIIPA